MTASDLVTLNVGGTTFQTTKSTLLLHPDSMLAALARFPSEPNPDSTDPSSTPTIFIDRDPAIFSVILSYLRTNELLLPAPSPSTPTLSSIQSEASGFYNLPHLASLANLHEPHLEVLLLEAKWSVGGRKWANGCSITKLPFHQSVVLHNTGRGGDVGGLFEHVFDMDGEALSWVLHTVENRNTEEMKTTGCTWKLRALEGRVEIPTRVVIVLERVPPVLLPESVSGDYGADKADEVAKQG